MEYLLGVCRCGQCEWVVLDVDIVADQPRTICSDCLFQIMLGREPPDRLDG